MFKVLIIACAFSLCYSIGRNPTASDHTVCQFRYATQYNTAQQQDPNIRAVAYNIGASGFPCRTNCRLVGRGTSTNLGETDSPNYLQCGTRMYCLKGRCVVPPTTSVTDA